jgi:hypothetical protein
VFPLGHLTFVAREVGRVQLHSLNFAEKFLCFIVEPKLRCGLPEGGNHGNDDQTDDQFTGQRHKGTPLGLAQTRGLDQPAAWRS